MRAASMTGPGEPVLAGFSSRARGRGPLRYGPVVMPAKGSRRLLEKPYRAHPHHPAERRLAARLSVLADTPAGVALWLSEPDFRTVRDQLVHTAALARHHLAELGEFLLGCPEPDYEPGPGHDRATWLAHFVAGGPRPPYPVLDLRLNRGRVTCGPARHRACCAASARQAALCCSQPSTSPSSGPARIRQITPPGPGRTSGTSTVSATGWPAPAPRPPEPSLTVPPAEGESP